MLFKSYIKRHQVSENKSKLNFASSFIFCLNLFKMNILWVTRVFGSKISITLLIEVIHEGGTNSSEMVKLKVIYTIEHLTWYVRGVNVSLGISSFLKCLGRRLGQDLPPYCKHKNTTLLRSFVTCMINICSDHMYYQHLKPSQHFLRSFEDIINSCIVSKLKEYISLQDIYRNVHATKSILHQNAGIRSFEIILFQYFLIIKMN